MGLYAIVSHPWRLEVFDERADKHDDHGPVALLMESIDRHVSTSQGRFRVPLNAGNDFEFSF